MLSLSKKNLLALLPFYLATAVSGQASGTGSTTRYWDCCKPSCAWPGKTTLASGANPVSICDVKGNAISDYNSVSGCDGGSAFMPSSESPWAVDDSLSYGYAAVNIAGGNEASWCCACYELTFTSGAVAGKKMIVQATNTGGDLGANQFDISMPGGGVGIFNGCITQWGTPSSGWGAQYGGVASRSACDSFPEALKAGCYWRFDWFQGADNPTVSFKQVTCPAALTAKTGCVRAGEVPTGSKEVSSPDPVASSSPIATAVETQAAAVATSADPKVFTLIENTSASSAEASIYDAVFEATRTGSTGAAVTAPVVAAEVAALNAQTSSEPTTTTETTTTVISTIRVHISSSTEYVLPATIVTETVAVEIPVSTTTVYDYSGC